MMKRKGKHHGPKLVFTDGDITQGHTNGLTNIQISERLGCSEATVSRRLKQLGLRPNKGTPPGRPERIQRFIDEWRAKNMSGESS